MLLVTAAAVLESSDRADDGHRLIEYLLDDGGAALLRRRDLRVPAGRGRRAVRRSPAARGGHVPPRRPRRAGRRPRGHDPADRAEWPPQRLISALRRLVGDRLGASRRRLSSPQSRSRWRPCSRYRSSTSSWRSLAGEADVLDIWTSQRTLVPLRQTLTLAVAVAATASAVGTALAWILDAHRRPGASHARAARAAPARVPVVRRRVRAGVVDGAGRPARRAARVTRAAGSAAHRGVRRRVVRPHAVHLSLRAPAGRGAAPRAPAVAGGERAAARTQAVAGAPHRRAAAGIERDLGRRAARLPLHRERLRRRAAAALRHVDPRDLREPLARPLAVGRAQPPARARRARSDGRRATVRASRAKRVGAHARASADVVEAVALARAARRRRAVRLGADRAARLPAGLGAADTAVQTSRPATSSAPPPTPRSRASSPRSSRSPSCSPSRT